MMALTLTALVLDGGEYLEQELDTLLQQGRDVNERDEWGDTPLHAAALKGRVTIVKKLLAAGADPKAANKVGSTPLHKAAVGGFHSVVSTLQEAGAPNQENDAGYGPGYYSKQMRDRLTAEKQSEFITFPSATAKNVKKKLMDNRGAVLKEIKEDTGLIDLEVKGDGVELTGSADTLLKAKEIIEKIFKETESTTRPGTKTARNFTHQETMQVPAEALGRIIGVRGERIKRIEQKTGAKITISKDSSDILLGADSLESVDEAIEMISRIVNGDMGGGRMNGAPQGRGSRYGANDSFSRPGRIGKKKPKKSTQGMEDAEMKDAKPPVDDLDGEEEEEEEEEVEEQDNLGSYTWQIKKFSKFRDGSKESDIFAIADSKWYMKTTIGGSHPASRHLALYLQVAEPKKLPAGWGRHVSFTFVIVNQQDESKNVERSTEHDFKETSTDWGFRTFVALSDLQKPGFLVDDTLFIRVDMEVRKSLYSFANWHSWDSRKETGYVGLKNQGATCYMNSLLQALFHLAMFRKAVYQLPTQNDAPENSIPLALQRVFYRLQFDKSSPGTKELTTSFGWTTRDSFVQHDVQELNRVFCDNLEAKMKGTISEGMIEKLFRGKIFNYIKCKNVDYESSRTEMFYDISLNVKGLPNVAASLEQYIAVETLDGENKYDAGTHGLQDAEKGCYFMSLPPVLALHLKRFIYDPERDMNVKINDHYEFPQSLNMKRFMHKDADMSVKPLYRLYSVLVHSGDVHGGHYYAYVRPTPKMEWFKFDDERVTRAFKKDVFQGTFGGKEKRAIPQAHGKILTSSFFRSSNAYMLLYIRESERDQILAPVLEEEIPSHLRERFEKQEAEKAARKKEKAEAHLYLELKVARISDYKNWHGFDLVDYDKVLSFRLRKETTLKDFKPQAAEAFGVPPHRQRYWQCPSRRNQTIRPDEPFSLRDMEAPLSKLAKSSVVKIFLEESEAPIDCTEESQLFHTPSPDEALMFFRYYEPSPLNLQFACKRFVNVKHTLGTLVPFLNEQMGFPSTTKLELFEEIKPTMVDLLNLDDTFEKAELSNGDILIFQKALPEGAMKQLEYPRANDYFMYMVNRTTVRFRELRTPDQDKHVLTLLKNNSYNEVVTALGNVLNVDPFKIRLTAHSTIYNSPRAYPIKCSEGPTLTQMLTFMNSRSIADILYYELLDRPIQELENNKLLKIDWYNEKVVHQTTHQVLVPKTSRMSDVIVKLKEEMPAVTGDVRLVEVQSHKITRTVSPDESVSGYNEHSSLRAEIIPEEEREKGAIRIQVVHHNAESFFPLFGSPFYFVIHKGEKVGEIKKRIQQKLDIADEEFAKWKCGLLHPFMGKSKLIQDDEVVLSSVINHDLLTLEHSAPKQQRANRRAPEIGIVIKN